MQARDMSDEELDAQIQVSVLMTKVSDLEARIRELLALMQNDILQGKVTLTPIRKGVMDDAKSELTARNR